MPNYQIYCINLKRREDRWQYMENLAAKHEFDLVRINAIDAKTEEETIKSAGLINQGPVGTLGIGTLACTLSHRKAWQTFLESDDEFGVFLEDDVVITSNFKADLDALIKQCNGIELLKLEAGGASKDGIVLGPVLNSGTPRNIRRCYQICTDAAGYVLSRSGAKQAIAGLSECQVPVDHFLFYPKPYKGVLGMPFHVVEPAMLVQDRSMQSNIKSSRFLGNSKWRQIRRAPYEVAPGWQMISALLFKRAKLIKNPFQK